MSLAEIESAIEQLPAGDVEQLFQWLHELRARRATPPAVERWLERARGAANAGRTTGEIMALTRGDE